MVIYRDGVAIELTSAELNQAHLEGELKKLRSEIESVIDENRLSFDNYESFGFGEYESADDAREDFVSYVMESYDERSDAHLMKWIAYVVEFTMSIAKDWGLK